MRYIFYLLLLSSSARGQFTAKDFRLHFGAGALAGGSAAVVSPHPVRDGLVFSAGIGLLKETYDAANSGSRFSALDLVSTAAGGYLSSLAVTSLRRYVARRRMLRQLSRRVYSL